MGVVSAHHSHPHAATDDAAATAATGAAGRSARALAEALRARGMRMTPQREHVLAAVHRLGHATPDELSEAVDGVDVATVYRTLELLEELGLVRHTHLGHGAASYRPADDQHIHVVCHTCGSVVDAPPDLVDPLADRLRADSGFELDRAHFTVFGRCAGCAASGANPAGVGTNTAAAALSSTR